MLRNKFLIFLFIMCVVLLALPRELVRMTLSIPLPGAGRVSSADFYQAFLCAIIFWGGTRDAYVNRAIKSLLGGVYFLIIVGISVGLMRGVDLRNLGLDIRVVIGFVAGLGFAKHLYQVTAKERTLLFVVFGIIMIVISGAQHYFLTILMADTITVYANANRSLRVLMDNFYILWAMSNFFLVRFFEVSRYCSERKMVLLASAVISLQFLIFLFNGIRSAMIIIIATWGLSLWAFYAESGGIKKSLTFLKIFVAFACIGIASSFFLQDRLYGWELLVKSSIGRVETIYETGITGGGRLDEVVGVLNELGPMDLLLGRGLGGTVQNYYIESDNPDIRATHVSIIMWLWKFGFVGVFVFILGGYYTLRTFFTRSRSKRTDLYFELVSARISSVGILVWILGSCMSGGWNRWAFMFVAIFSVDVYRYWLMKRRRRRDNDLAYSVNHNAVI